jgi:methionine synthase I (cobalamin-dependent)
MYSLDEALSALRAAQKVTGVPVSVCMTFDKNPRGFFTLMGETVPHCMKRLKDSGADIIGSNCTHGTTVFCELTPLIRDSTDLPVIVQPNLGRPGLEGGEMTYKQTIDEYVEDILKIASRGVNIIGGCCGTTPEFIARMRGALGDRLEASHAEEERS